MIDLIEEAVKRKTALDTQYFLEAERLYKLLGDDGDYKNPVFGKGAIFPKLMMIGEAPGDFEVREASPFVGKAGKQLDEILSSVNIDRKEIYVTNAVKFRPILKKTRTVSNRTPKINEIRKGLPLLKREIDLVEPSVIATLGRIPLFAIAELFLNERPTLSNAHGKFFSITFNGILFKFFPMYHPASAIYRRELLNVLKEDALILSNYLNLKG
ncbi:MAG: uracil-DNA glycosylase [Clostridia bacterium]